MDMDFGVQSLDRRPTFSRQRSNSVPALFSLANVSDEEASVLFSAAERATARRRRPVSVDSPGPIINNTQHQTEVPKQTFNFSTPSRFGIGKSPLRNVVIRVSMDQAVEAKQEEEKLEVVEQEQEEEEEEETPSYEVEPAPIPPRQLLSPTCLISIRSQSPCSNISSQDPTSSRRQVANENLKAYANSLLLFTRSRLDTVTPQTLYLSGQLSNSSVPPTPELEEDVVELRFQRPTLRSHFSNWSSTTGESADDDDTDSRHLSFASSMEPRTPDEESGMISPDSFFNEATPRVGQATDWTSISSARPSSQISVAQMRHSYTSNTMNDPNSESFSYFAGFDSVSAIASSRLSASPFDFEVLQTPPTPSGISSRSRSRPVSSASNFTPFPRRRPHTPFGEGMDISRPPSWLVRAVS